MMKPFIFISSLCFLLFLNACKTTKTSAPAAILPVPTEKQIAWHEMEQYAFIHFTTNTFTGKEWGYGDENPSIFNPTALDADQWVKVIKDAGLKAVILTCKHHDGFTLWPSKFTEHSIKASPYKNGNGDLVKEVSQACKKYGLKFGIYLSPWDRNHPDYGKPAYVEYYRNQLKELFTAYGPVFEMWFDGANGGDGYYGGKREKRSIRGATYYDWPRTLEIVRDIEPKIIFFSDAGPDIRWVGNERGVAGRTNWNNITSDTLYAGKAGIENLLNTGHENGKNWIPAEVDVSIRPGWFYHAEEDAKVKSPEKLFEIYLSSVGRGSNLLLNIPPDRRGLIHENDVASLQGWKKLMDEAFKVNLAKGSKVYANAVRGKNKAFKAGNLTDGKTGTYWAAPDDVKRAELVITLPSVRKISYVTLQEYIRLGQRIKSFSVEVQQGGSWKEVARETTIGYKRIVKIDSVETESVRIKILDSKACPVLSEIALF
ncbi:glycoside hydrolase family 29 [Emticicia sp. CRIBPO]|uniref:alpha-L-fucosidase n=1 Tax=Emticicia sp. CRIBPO TaxID=2683258 RepID=UPI001412B69A|nr:alpha-L-fucosidase [Emticicia sp. CRIBPO]NBA85067.1 glycoside hydrolase family 29 [Emticicia sp. CRIBPO]